MGTTKQAAKRDRQSKVFRAKNRAIKTRIKNITKEFESETAIEKRSEILKKAFSILDKASKKNVIHHRTAARKKSVLSRQLNAAQPEDKIEPGELGESQET
ncbi:MAG: 30S ribosomal protein S20 [candidate division Zixibacteria bacterium]|nr:30S ribosomal protein S20 [candidate division Zixibacteria bacterium]